MDYANIILEMLSRIKKLEEEVTQLKTEKRDTKTETNSIDDMQNSNKRDTTRYLFEGAVYAKNRLVLAVVKAYVENNKPLTRSQLRTAFERSLQGSIGVVEYKEIAEQRSDCEIRFFTKLQDTLHLVDGDMFVCTQWGIGNITNFLKRAAQLGFEIETIR